MAAVKTNHKPATPSGSTGAPIVSHQPAQRSIVEGLRRETAVDMQVQF